MRLLLSAVLVLAPALLCAGAETSAYSTDQTIRALILKLQKTGPAVATYEVKRGARKIASITISYSHPTLAMVIRHEKAGHPASRIWINGLDAYTRGADGVLRHRNFHRLKDTMQLIEARLKSAFEWAGKQKLPGVKKSLAEAWKANIAQLNAIGVVVDIYFIPAGGEDLPAGSRALSAKVAGRVHIDPNPSSPFGWFTFPDKMDKPEEGVIVLTHGSFRVKIDALTGWALGAEWLDGNGLPVAVMERSAFTTGDFWKAGDIMPPEWERKLAVEEDAVEKHDLARIAAMPLWMYVADLSKAQNAGLRAEATRLPAAGGGAGAGTLKVVSEIAYLYYSAVLETILGKDFIVESAAVLQGEFASLIEDLKKDPSLFTPEEGKKVSDKIDEVARELLDRQGRLLAQQGFTGMDFLFQAMGADTKPPDSLKPFVQSTLQGFTGAYNNRIGMPVHGMVRWNFRQYWLEPTLREEKRREKAGKAVSE